MTTGTQAQDVAKDAKGLHYRRILEAARQCKAETGREKVLSGALVTWLLDKVAALEAELARAHSERDEARRASDETLRQHRQTLENYRACVDERDKAQRELANVNLIISQPAREAIDQIAKWQAELARAREALRKEVRSAEMQAAIMRDPARIGDGPPAHHKLCERVADAFERTAERMSAALKDADNG